MSSSTEHTASPAFSIGRLARRTNTPVQTIRFYERIGLLPLPSRTRGGQRRYDDGAHARLSFVRHARDLGLSLPAIRELLDAAEAPGAVPAVRHIAAIDQRIVQLTALKSELQRLLQASGQSNAA